VTGPLPPARSHHATVAWRWATDPLTPVLVLALAGVLCAAHAPVLTWAVVGGLAGYTLSGSV
jgi:hypothetical protein